MPRMWISPSEHTPSSTRSVVLAGIALLVLAAVIGVAVSTQVERRDPPLVDRLMTTLAVVVVGAAVLVMQLHERRRRELAAALRQLRTVLELAPDAVLQLDDQGVITFANARAAALLGAESRTLIGAKIEQRLEGAHLSDDEEHRLELQTIKLGSREIPVEVRVSRLDGGAQIAVIRDVTERVRTEREREALLAREQQARQEQEASRKRLEIVLESAPVGILYLGSDGTELGNPALAGLVGSGNPLRQLSLALRGPDGGELAPEQLPWARALAGERLEALELLRIRPRGGTAPVLVHAAPVLGPTGATIGAIVSVEDASAQAELTRLREEYLGLVSHDLRNPLSAIVLSATLLERELRASGGDLATEAAAIRRSAGRIDAMIEELLQTTLLETGHSLPMLQELDLRDVITDCVSRTSVPLERARLQLALAQDLPLIRGDLCQLDRVLSNLISNALKYSPRESSVVVRALRTEAELVVSVEDHGPGLAPEDAARVFDKYFRAGSAHGRRGFGLGLYICRLIIEAHHGRIWVDSALGRGSAFHFALPLQAAEPGDQRATVHETET